MSTPTARLQTSVDATRAALDAGEITRLRACRRVARHCRAALRKHPFDNELSLAVSHVAALGFFPPAHAELPPGDDEELWCTLTGRQDVELITLAANFVAWPEPSEEPEEAKRILALFLLVASEHERAHTLLEALVPHAAPSTIALWRFRLASAQLDQAAQCDPDAWSALLEPLRALGQDGAAELGSALHVAASALIANSTAHGAEWMQPVLGGQMILSARLALRRRPVLREELAPAIAWLEEGERLVKRPALPLIDILDGVDAADAAGDFRTGTAQLEAALSMAADRHDLAPALAARAAALGDAVLMARATALGAAAVTYTPIADSVSEPDIAVASRGMEAWTSALQELADPDTLPDAPDRLVFLEHAGSRRRAARGWMARGEPSDLLQAVRLADALTSEEAELLTARMLKALPDDELTFDPIDEMLGHSLYSRLTDDAQHTVLALRLGAMSHVSNAPVTASDHLPTQQPDVDDPHSLENRLAAAKELLEAERMDAAGAILAALLRHDAGPDGRNALVDLTVQALRAEEPAGALVTAATRAILGEDEPGPTLLSRLVENAMAAYAVHDGLHTGALDRRRPESLRVRLLEAWFGIWSATKTPPDPVGLQDLMHVDPVLLPLAASRLASLPDPVASAAAFLVEHPPLETTPAEYGRALLDLVVSAAG